jgi:hypothetical protein
MVLHPLEHAGSAGRSRSSSPQPIPAWHAVEKRQRQSAKQWLLITQVDHAQLAGDLAARLESPLIPQLTPDLVRAIALHDAGWEQFDTGADKRTRELHPRLNDDGRPLSFLDVTPADFVVAWNGSITQAEQVCPAGGFIVSRHFFRLGEGRLNSQIDDEEDTSRLRQFLHAEKDRQARLSRLTSCSSQELETLTDVLQFCDLLSLYLCSGASEAVEFPQAFGNVHVAVQKDEDMFRCEPSMFGSGVSLGVCGRLYGEAAAGSRELAFLLQ